MTTIMRIKANSILLSGRPATRDFRGNQYCSVTRLPTALFHRQPSQALAELKAPHHLATAIACGDRTGIEEMPSGGIAGRGLPPNRIPVSTSTGCPSWRNGLNFQC